MTTTPSTINFEPWSVVRVNIRFTNGQATNFKTDGYVSTLAKKRLAGLLAESLVELMREVIEHIARDADDEIWKELAEKFPEKFDINAD